MKNSTAQYQLNTIPTAEQMVFAIMYRKIFRRGPFRDTEFWRDRRSTEHLRQGYVDSPAYQDGVVNAMPTRAP